MKKSRYKGIILILLSAFCACIGQMFWKLFTTQTNVFMLFLGFSFYGIGALLMVIAYRYGELSVLQPMLSTNYIFSIILGYIVFQEYPFLHKIIGILIITLGVILIGSEK